MGNITEYEPPLVITKTVDLLNGYKAVYLEQDEGVYVAFLDTDGKMIHLSSGAFYLTPACVEAIDEVKLVLSKAEKTKELKERVQECILHYDRIITETEKAILIFETVAEKDLWIPKSQIKKYDLINKRIQIKSWLYKSMIKDGRLPRF